MTKGVTDREGVKENLIYFITGSKFNAYQMWVKLVFFYVQWKKYGIFSLVTDTIYIFTVGKEGFLGNVRSGIFYQKVLSEVYLSEIMLQTILLVTILTSILWILAPVTHIVFEDRKRNFECSTTGLDNKTNILSIKLDFFSYSAVLTYVFGCSKEPSHWEGSFEYPQHMFWMRNKKNSVLLHTLN